jgi:uncharacterized membrane protein
MATLCIRGEHRRSVFGDVALVGFLLAQVFDGALTYVGVSAYGPHVEANPLLAWLMSAVGHGPALTGSKIVAAAFGIALHLGSVHRAVALLTLFYLVVAIVPWLALLYF